MQQLAKEYIEFNEKLKNTKNELEEKVYEFIEGYYHVVDVEFDDDNKVICLALGYRHGYERVYIEYNQKSDAWVDQNNYSKGEQQHIN